MFGPKIRIEKDLYERVKSCSEEAGYSSVEEFVTHVLEKEVEKHHRQEEDQSEVEKRLRGLGYLD